VFPDVYVTPTVDDLHSGVNMAHMEIFHHYMTDNAGIYPLFDGSLKQIITSTALRQPLVMHSVLALSAYHLSVVRRDQQAFYQNLAMQLQTRALSLFNSIDLGSLGDSVEKRIPIFIFSCILGFLGLCDMLSHRDGDFPAAFARFQGYLRLHRGIYTVMQGHWDQLRRTELGIIFDDLVPQRYQMDVEGHDCDDIRGRIESSSLDTEELEGARKAINTLQWVFDASPSPKSRAYALCDWAVLVPAPFAATLETGRPEALAILAYYFLALHLCRDMWLIGDSGRFLLTLLVDHFRGGPWEAWVETPYRMLKDSLEKDALKNQFLADVDSMTPHQNPSGHLQQPS
jgi:hypothetical protein